MARCQHHLCPRFKPPFPVAEMPPLPPLCSEAEGGLPGCPCPGVSPKPSCGAGVHSAGAPPSPRNPRNALQGQAGCTARPRRPLTDDSVQDPRLGVLSSPGYTGRPASRKMLAGLACTPRRSAPTETQTCPSPLRSRLPDVCRPGSCREAEGAACARRRPFLPFMWLPGGGPLLGEAAIFKSHLPAGGGFRSELGAGGGRLQTTHQFKLWAPRGRFYGVPSVREHPYARRRPPAWRCRSG